MLYFINTRIMGFHFIIQYFSKPVFCNIKTGEEIQAFCTLIIVGANPFKAAIAEYGPVIFNETISRETLLYDLKNFCFPNKVTCIYKYVQTMRIWKNLLKHDSSFHTKLLFPFHQQEEYDSNIYNKPEDELLKGFKMQCRRKIVFGRAGEFLFFKKLETPEHFLQLNKLFNKAAKEKGYKYMPFYIYRNLVQKWQTTWFMRCIWSFFTG